MTFALYQNTPDPFDTSTHIAYDLPKDAHVYLCVEDSIGDSVLTLVWGMQAAGSYQAQFIPDSSITPGRYFCKMVADTFVDSIMMHYRTSVTSVARLPQISNRDFLLKQNYPNPFNPSTSISYDLPANGLVVLKVFDALGRELETLVNEREGAGNHSVVFNATDLPSGVYFYRLQAGTSARTKKLMILK